MHREEREEERDPLTGAVIGAAIEVHRLLGPGLLESVYERCLCHELHLRGIPVRRQVRVPVVYKTITLEESLVLDVLVDDRLILELKAVERMDPLFEAQLLTYLRLSGIRHGLLINFNVPLLKNGLKRMVL
jgi:GxxExxY protein